MADPIEIKGRIVRSDREISIVIENDSQGMLAGLDDGQSVNAILWDARPLSELPLIEQLSEVQQLERTIIAQGLKSKGAIADKEDFLRRLSIVG